MVFAYVGIFSALLFLVGDTPYLLDTLKGKTKPHRVTWGVITVLNAIGFANQFASGATNSLWLFGAGTGMTLLIFLGSLRHGEGGESISDITCLIIAVLGIALWLLFKSPIYSIFANIIADIAALLPTYKKASKHPESETRVSWLIGTICIILTTVSVGKLDWHLLLLPIASAIMQSYMVYLLYRHPKTLQLHDNTKP